MNKNVKHTTSVNIVRKQSIPGSWKKVAGILKGRNIDGLEYQKMSVASDSSDRALIFIH
jgi:hypothetical protein